MTEGAYTMLPDGTIAVALSEDVTVFASELEDFPIAGIYFSWAQGSIYLRCTDKGAEGVEIRDVTVAVLRYSRPRLRRATASVVAGSAPRRWCPTARVAMHAYSAGSYISVPAGLANGTIRHRVGGAKRRLGRCTACSWFDSRDHASPPGVGRRG